MGTKKRSTSGTGRAALGILLLALIILGDIVSGAVGIASPVTVAIAGCNNPASLEQCGTATCTVPGTATGGQQGCQVIVTFPQAFPSIPSFATATFAGFNNGINHNEKQVPLFSTDFQADNAETWAAFPAALTEIYGTINHEVGTSSNELQIAVAADFFASCVATAGIQTGTETLQPQYFNPLLGTWHDLAQNAGTMNLVVGGVFCGASGGTSIFSNIQAIDPVAISSSSTEFRVVGFGGGGAGDSMTFNNIYLVFYATFLQTVSLCIQIVSACPSGLGGTNTPLSKTQMVIAANIPFPLPVSGFQVNIKWMATE